MSSGPDGAASVYIPGYRIIQFGRLGRYSREYHKEQVEGIGDEHG